MSESMILRGVTPGGSYGEKELQLTTVADRENQKFTQNPKIVHTTTSSFRVPRVAHRPRPAATTKPTLPPQQSSSSSSHSHGYSGDRAHTHGYSGDRAHTHGYSGDRPHTHGYSAKRDHFHRPPHSNRHPHSNRPHSRRPHSSRPHSRRSHSHLVPTHERLHTNALHPPKVKTVVHLSIPKKSMKETQEEEIKMVCFIF